MEFDELETFIEEENARLKKLGKVLCATISNSYDYMVVMVKRSMNLAKTVVAAAASFRVAETKEDCEFPTLTDYMDLFYFYSIIVLCAFMVLILIEHLVHLAFQDEQLEGWPSPTCLRSTAKIKDKSRYKKCQKYMLVHLLKSFHIVIYLVQLQEIAVFNLNFQTFADRLILMEFKKFLNN